MKQKRTAGSRTNSALIAKSLDTLAVTVPTHATFKVPKQTATTEKAALPESSRFKAFPQVIAPIVAMEAEAEAEAVDEAALKEEEVEEAAQGITTTTEK